MDWTRLVVGLDLDTGVFCPGLTPTHQAPPLVFTTEQLVKMFSINSPLLTEEELN